MERRRPALTSEQYARAILSHSRRHSGTSVFPGDNYLDFAEWMLQERSLLTSSAAGGNTNAFASTSDQSHPLVVVYSTGDKRWDVKHYRQAEHEAFSATERALEDDSGQMIFLRGFASPSWISAIGSKYQVDPDFFRRHMDFLSVSVDRHAYSFPPLPSTSHNIFRLCVSTILHRDHSGERDLHTQREDQNLQLATYRMQKLRSTNVSCGDSLVRDYSTLCSSFSVLEQWISVYVTKKEKGWAVIAWMDHGRSLEKSPSGPWTSHIQSKATALPVLQSHRKMTFRNTTSRLDPDYTAPTEVQQSVAILPLQYESLIALADLTNRASNDPLSMCIPLFAHAAFSEQQFLNLIRSKIQAEVDAVSMGIPENALGTFQFFSNILNRHAHNLKTSRRALHRLAERNGQGSNGGKANNDNLRPRNSGTPSPSPSRATRQRQPDIGSAHQMPTNAHDGPFTVNGLMEDYEELHLSCIELSQLCTRGTTLAMNKATIDESRKGIEQSARLKKLTFLATFFIPLSFSSSLFGMNLDVLSHNGVRFWWFFVLCIPITMLAYMLYLWDWQAIRQFWRRVGKRLGRNKSADKTGMSSKDPVHIV